MRKNKSILWYVVFVCIAIPYLLCVGIVWYSFGYIAYVHMLRLGMMLCEKSWIVKVCAMDIGIIVGGIMIFLTNFSIFGVIGKTETKRN